MFEGHPWQGEDFGEVEYEWFLARGYVFNVEFDVDVKPFIDFCREGGFRSNQLMMKIGVRLSKEFLPQRTVALKKRDYPVRYPAGYIRPVREGSDMLEHIAVEEYDDRFEEYNIREQINPFQRWMMTRHPKFTVWLAKRFFGRREAKKNYAFMVSRNPLKGLNTRVVFHGTHYRTFVLTVPFGELVQVTFGAPHALGNINYYEPLLLKFKTWMEQPEQIPKDLLEKPYKETPRK
jgi:hypothetical protein